MKEDIIKKLEESREKLKQIKICIDALNEKNSRSLEGLSLTIDVLKTPDDKFCIESNNWERLCDSLDRNVDILYKNIKNENIGNVVSAITGITSTTSIVCLSGTAFCTSNQDYLSNPPYSKLANFVKREKNQEQVSMGLNSIDPNLSIEYYNSWKSFNSLLEDRTRSSMALMRGVIDELYIQLAPNEKVIEYFKLNSKEKISKRARIKYIAYNLINDKEKRETFLMDENAFADVTNKLSDFKKHGKLDEIKTESYLYHADHLINLLLDSIDKGQG